MAAAVGTKTASTLNWSLFAVARYLDRRLCRTLLLPTAVCRLITERSFAEESGIRYTSALPNALDDSLTLLV